jgi:hypothetical protein
LHLFIEFLLIIYLPVEIFDDLLLLIDLYFGLLAQMSHETLLMVLVFLANVHGAIQGTVVGEALS